MTLGPDSAYEFTLLALSVWREARGTSLAAKRAVAFTIRNRATHPSWWGNGWAGVILKPSQFSSFNKGDPNAVLFQRPQEVSWLESLQVAEEVFGEIKTEDPTNGATHYYSNDIPAPVWTKAMIQTAAVGPFLFFKKESDWPAHSSKT